MLSTGIKVLSEIAASSISAIDLGLGVFCRSLVNDSGRLTDVTWEGPTVALELETWVPELGPDDLVWGVAEDTSDDNLLVASEPDCLVIPEDVADRLVIPEDDADRLVTPEEPDRLVIPEDEPDRLVTPEAEEDGK